MPNAQLDRVVAGLGQTLGEKLVGVYLHGSLVLGCFNPARSDVDLLVVTRHRLLPVENARVLDVLRSESGSYDRPGWPRPLELSSLALDHLRPWRYPTPYDLHFSSGNPVGVGPGEDHDLAAHIWILRRRGRALAGPPVAEVFPEVPEADYLDSLARDFAWCRDERHERPRYAILSMTRVWAARATREVQSKESGALWALERLPDDLRPLVEGALESYRGEVATSPSTASSSTDSPRSSRRNSAHEPARPAQSPRVPGRLTAGSATRQSVPTSSPLG